MKMKKHKKNFFKALVTLFFVTSLQVNSVYSAKYPHLTIPLEAISEELADTRIEDVGQNKSGVYFKFYNGQYLAIKSEKKDMKFYIVPESEEKEAEEALYNGKRYSLACEEYQRYGGDFRTYVEKYNLSLEDVEASNICLDPVERLNRSDACSRYAIGKSDQEFMRRHHKRVEAPTATYAACGQKVEIVDKVKLEDGRSIFCFRSIPRARNIDQLFLLKDKLYITEDFLESIFIYDAESLNYLGLIPLDGYIKGICLRNFNSDVYIHHMNRNKNQNSISILSKNNWKKEIRINVKCVDTDDYEWAPILTEHQSKIYTFCGNELYIAPVYPSLKAVRELIEQEDYYLYFLDIHPNSHQRKALQALISDNKKFFAKDTSTLLYEKSIRAIALEEAADEERRRPRLPQCNALTLESMPDEVILNILKYLEDNDVIQEGLINKRFYNLSHESIAQLRYLKLALHAVQGKTDDDNCVRYLLQLLRSKDKLATEIAEYIVNKPYYFRGNCSEGDGFSIFTKGIVNKKVRFEL